MAVKSSFVLMRSPSFSNFKCNLFASRNSSNPCFLSHADASIFSFWPKSMVYTALGSAPADSISPMIMAIPSIAAHRHFLEFVFTPSVPYRLLVMTSTEKHISPAGFTETDLVSHSGNSEKGEFVHSLNLTDIFSTWVEGNHRTKARSYL